MLAIANLKRLRSNIMGFPNVHHYIAPAAFTSADQAALTQSCRSWLRQKPITSWLLEKIP